MKTTTEHTRALCAAFENPTRGVVGLVDDMLKACSQETSLHLDWQADGCRLVVAGCDHEESFKVPVRKSVFRAILARVATLCNERVPNSVSPYGGHGELTVSAIPGRVFRLDFFNTPDKQSLELTNAEEKAAEATA